MKAITFFLIVLLTTSCNMLSPQAPVTIKERLKPGSILHLKQPVVIPKDRLFIYIANGKVAPVKNFNTVDIYHPYCMLYLQHEVKQAHTVMPGQFKVTKITEWEGYYSRRGYIKYARAYTQQAGLVKTGLNKTGSASDGGSSTIMYATILRLHSSKQPEVKKMVCGHWDDQSLVEPLTLDELKIALGDLMTIEAKGI